MSEVLFQSKNILITRSVAKFDNATYPIANIGSVVIEREPGFFAILTVFIGIVLGLIFGFGANAVIGIGIFLASVVLARFLPHKRKLTLKTSSGDVTALKSGNVQLVENVQQAIESAFAR